jgi:hypothetical protein
MTQKNMRSVLAIGKVIQLDNNYIGKCKIQWILLCHMKITPNKIPLIQRLFGSRQFT